MSYHPDQPPSYQEATGIWPASGSAVPSAPPQRSLSPPQDDISMWFYAVDEDFNGHITADELRQALLDEKCRPFSLATCRMLVAMFDDNSNGEIELSEFVQLYHYVRKWRAIFLQHDADKSGTIELGELVTSLNTVHQPTHYSRQFCEQMLHRFGNRQKNGKYCLSLDNFIALNARLNRLLNEFTGRSDTIEEFLLSRMRSN